MPHSFSPDMSNYNKIIETASKAKVDKYTRIGWKLIETYTDTHPVAGKGQTIVMYQIGWPKDAGEPVELPDEEDPLEYKQGPSAN